MTTQDVLKDGEGIRIGRDGRPVRIVKDKSSVYVPLMMMDGRTVTVGVTDDVKLHRPGAHLTTDAAAIDRRQSSYDSYLADLNNGWRNPPPVVIADEKKAPVTTDASEGAYNAMVAGLADAWRSA